jgi:hypothetical protein
MPGGLKRRTGGFVVVGRVVEMDFRERLSKSSDMGKISCVARGAAAM